MSAPGQTAPAPPATLPSLRDAISAHGLEPRKALGQHFLLDPSIVARIAAIPGDLAGRHVVEIGPGPGGLTRALLATQASRVEVVELDRRAIPLLEDLGRHYPGRLGITETDATRLDATTLALAPRQIVANLPYNVGTPLLIGWLRQAGAWEAMTLMFQYEVALRICAAPHSDHYGRLGVIAQWCCTCDVAMLVPAGAFFPAPKVDSAVVLLRPHAHQPGPALFAAMERVTAAAFGQRRKMLRSSLKGLGGDALLERANIDPTRRAETLSVAEFAALATLLAAESR